nr:neutrophil gelatinase-associated lipocalin-like isoform X1 [Cavia porcellus]
MVLSLLCLSLIVLEALHSQAQDIPPTRIPAPPLSKIPLQPDFQDDRFQGDWFTIGAATNAVMKGKGNNSKYYMTRVNFELNDDHSYNVSTTGLSGQKCAQWTSTLVPYIQPGQFTRLNMTNSDTESYLWRVTATDYEQFAMLYIEYKFKHRIYFQVKLNGRTQELSSELQEHFIKFARSLGLGDENTVYFEPIGFTTTPPPILPVTSIQGATWLPHQTCQ